jgi:N-acetylglutamate synthase
MSTATANATVEPMTPADFGQVLSLWAITEGVGLNESDTEPHLTGYIARNPGMSFVARVNGGIVGAVLCGHDGRRGYLHHLAVAKEHRNQGIGKRLVNACLAQLESLGIPKCNIFLYANNADGEAFWRHNGWMNRTDLCVLQKVISNNS